MCVQKEREYLPLFFCTPSVKCCHSERSEAPAGSPFGAMTLCLPILLLRLLRCCCGIALGGYQCEYRFSPTGSATASLFCFGGSGQVAYGVYAQGGFCRRLKSSTR